MKILIENIKLSDAYPEFIELPPSHEDNGKVLFQHEVKYSDGFKVVLEVVSSGINKNSSTHIVMYDKEGTNIACSIVYNHFIGDYSIEFYDEKYILKVS